MNRIIPRDGSLFQRDVSLFSEQLLAIPLFNGQLIEDINLSTTVLNVPHSLGRAYRGFIVVYKNANIDIWVDSTSTTDKSLYIALDASGTVNVSIWIF